MWPESWTNSAGRRSTSSNTATNRRNSSPPPSPLPKSSRSRWIPTAPKLPGHGAGLPALPGHRQQGTERPAGSQVDGLENRYPAGKWFLWRGRRLIAGCSREPGRRVCHRWLYGRAFRETMRFCRAGSCRLKGDADGPGYTAKIRNPPGNRLISIDGERIGGERDAHKTGSAAEMHRLR